MIFRRKKRGMVDLTKLQERGIVQAPPKKEPAVPQDREGFVDFGSMSSPKKSGSNSDFFGFSESTKSNVSNSFSTEISGYNKREVDAKITELDNKIYKLEQRLEVLERKIGVGPSTDSNYGGIGW